jgi:hypothetical protein
MYRISRSLVKQINKELVVYISPANKIILADKIPSPTNKIPYPTDKIPYPTDKIPYPTDKIPYPTDKIPYPTDKIPYPAINNTPADKIPSDKILIELDNRL